MFLLPATLMMIQFNMSKLAWRYHFSIISLWDIFQALMGVNAQYLEWVQISAILDPSQQSWVPLSVLNTPIYLEYPVFIQSL